MFVSIWRTLFNFRLHERLRRSENAGFGKRKRDSAVLFAFCFSLHSGNSEPAGTLHVARKGKQSASLVVRWNLDNVQQKAVQHFPNRRSFEPER